MKWRPLTRTYGDRPQQMASMPPHQILEIPETASRDAIKAAYRRMVKIYHPDKTDVFLKKSNAEILKIVNEAYKAMLAKHSGQ